jgi:hypothetical protein
MQVVQTDPAAKGTAAYISEMADELHRLAQNNNMAFLAYLLAMAAREARRGVAKAQPPPARKMPRVVIGGRH